VRGTGPGIGSLVACDRGTDGLPTRAFPLENTAVQARLEGPVASVDVSQRFRNPYGDTIEAAYVFPLPNDAAVGDFVLRVGDRVIRGIVREREEAEAMHRDARAQGHVASLLTEERTNIFMEKVANIEPGASIEVTLTYYNMIDYRDGWYEWRFPLVVGPRFNPPGERDGIGSTRVGGSVESDQKTHVEYLRPGARTDRGVQIDVAIDAGVPIRALESPSHTIVAAPPESSIATARFVGGEELANRDFVLRYRVAGAEPQVGLVSTKSADGKGYFALTLYPPEVVRIEKRAPIDLVYVIDRSGSMSGRPLAQVKEVVRASLGKLHRGDRFQIVDFGSDARGFGDAMVVVDDRSIVDARRHVDALNADGGTMVLEGLRRALALPSDEGRVRYLVFLTDGFVSNEAEIIGEMHKTLAGRRVFAFGIGSSANWAMLEGMADTGRGAVADISSGGDAVAVMDAFMERIAHPIVHDATLSLSGVSVDQLWPRRMPDLIAGRPVTVFGIYTGSGTSQVSLHGWSGSERVERTWMLTFANDTQSKALERIWARAQIATWSDDATWQPERGDEIRRDILATALRYGIASPYTAFVAVDGSRVTSGSDRRTVVQPVPMPEGVRYETSVDGRR